MLRSPCATAPGGGGMLFLGKDAKQTKRKGLEEHVKEMGWHRMLHSPNSTTAEE